MKKIWFYAIVQGIVIFFIVGGMTYALRGDFFFRYLSPIFGLAAAVLRFGTATLMILVRLTGMNIKTIQRNMSMHWI